MNFLQKIFSIASLSIVLGTSILIPDAFAANFTELRVEFESCVETDPGRNHCYEDFANQLNTINTDEELDFAISACNSIVGSGYRTACYTKLIKLTGDKELCQKDPEYSDLCEFQQTSPTNPQNFTFEDFILFRAICNKYPAFKQDLECDSKIDIACKVNKFQGCYKFDFSDCNLEQFPETCIAQKVRSAYLNYARLNHVYFDYMTEACERLLGDTRQTYCLNQIEEVQEEERLKNEAITTRITKNKQRYAEEQTKLERQGEYLRVAAIMLLAVLIIWLFITFFREGPLNFIRSHKRLIIYTVIGLFLSVFNPLAYFITVTLGRRYFLFERSNTLALIVTAAVVSAIIFLVLGLRGSHYENRFVASIARIAFVLLILAELGALFIIFALAFAGFGL